MLSQNQNTIFITILVILIITLVILTIIRYFQVIPKEKETFVQQQSKVISLNQIKVYLINMKKNVERFKKFQADFQKTDLSSLGFTKTEAVVGKNLDMKKYLNKQSLDILKASEKDGYRKHHYQLTRGAVGCYLSHLNTYKAISKQNQPYGFIFEDDVKILKPELLKDVNKTIQNIPNDWDILLLGCVCFVCGKFYSYYDVNRYFLMHGYIIKKESAIKILDMLDKKPIEQQIDAKFSDLAERGLLKIYCLRDKLAVQRDMGTSIQVPIKHIEGINPFDPLLSKDYQEDL